MKKNHGFRVSTLSGFDFGMKADAGMHRITFSLKERLALIPMELAFLLFFLLALSRAFILNI